MKIISFIFLALAFMPSMTEAGQPGAIDQLSAATAAAAAAPEPALEKERVPAGLRLLRSIKSRYWEKIECW
ncbi:MAG: hypothetical protein HY550_01275, partial [Elusimicrobia bacterium]|nr:hypothetical protein [Elusimicrobiota bacterium]